MQKTTESQSSAQPQDVQGQEEAAARHGFWLYLSKAESNKSARRATMQRQCAPKQLEKTTYMEVEKMIERRERFARSPFSTS